MPGTIVLVHGAWVTPESWTGFRDRFEASGFEVHAPSWPLIEGLAAPQVNASVPDGFGALRLSQIVDHLAAFIGQLPHPPFIVGHSVGGLLTQLLLDRGLGSAGVAINPVPIAGIVPGPRALRAIAPIVARPGGWRRPYAFSRRRFAALYATGAPDSVIDRALDEYVIPAPGRIFHQVALWRENRIDPTRRWQPLLITGSDRDMLVTPYLSRSAFAIQRRSPAPTELVMLPGRSHLLIAEPGWQEVADLALDWLNRIPLARAGGRTGSASPARRGPFALTIPRFDDPDRSSD